MCKSTIGFGFIKWLCIHQTTGLGETYLALEKSALAQDFNGRAVDRMLDGLTVLAKWVPVNKMIIKVIERH